VRGVEAAGHQARHETGVRGQYFVRPDHWKPPAQKNDDRRLHAGQRLRQDDIARQRCPMPAIGAVEPVNAPKIFRIRVVGADRFEARPYRIRDVRRISQLGPGRQAHLRVTQACDGRATAFAVHDLRPDEEWFAHGADATSLGCAPAAHAAANEAR
jgi:hypothetical protein